MAAQTSLIIKDNCFDISMKKSKDYYTLPREYFLDAAYKQKGAIFQLFFSLEGPFICYEVGGWGGGGGHAKKTIGFKGGGGGNQKIWSVKGGGGVTKNSYP